MDVNSLYVGQVFHFSHPFLKVYGMVPFKVNKDGGLCSCWMYYMLCR